MAGIAGIISFTGDPEAIDALARMTEAMSYRGPDGIAHWCSSHAALGQCILHTNDEATRAELPLVSRSAKLTLVFDGWLSNWQELKHELSSKGVVLVSCSDAALVLAAYELWGANCAARLDGDFAFAIWNADSQTLFCARDQIGNKQLFFSWDGRTFRFATDVHALLASKGIPAVLDRGMLAEILAGDWHSRDHTMWRHIERLLPAHQLIVGMAGPKRQRYWSPPFGAAPLYSRDSDYIDHYREVFFDTVRRTCRSHRPIACEVSGGLDSSAGVCVADALRRQGELPAPDLRAYTWKFEPTSDADEIEYARAVGQHLSIEVAEVEPFRPDLDWFGERFAHDRTLTDYPNGMMAMSLRQRMAADGCGVVMNGEGGDEFIGGRRTYYADELTLSRHNNLWQSARADFDDLGLLTTLQMFVRHGLVHKMPKGVRRLGRRMFAPKGPNNYDSPFWLSSHMEQVFEAQRTRWQNPYEDIPDLSQRGLAMRLESAWADHIRELLDRGAARHGLEVRSPYFNRALIELAFRMPERMRIRGSVNKYCHLKALGHVLPNKVAVRRSKADFSVAFRRLLDDMRPLLTEEIPSQHPELINKVGMERLYANYQAGHPLRDALWELWTIFAVSRIAITAEGLS